MMLARVAPVPRIATLFEKHRLERCLMPMHGKPVPGFMIER
jgi:hypothetical protein